MSEIHITPETHEVLGASTCPICTKPAKVYRRKQDAEIFEGACARCGDLRISLQAAEFANRQEKAHLLSAWLRRQPAAEAPSVIVVATVERIFKDAPEYSPLEKLEITLSALATTTAGPGDLAKFDSATDYPLVYARSAKEAVFYIKELESMGYLMDTLTKDGYRQRLLTKGYQRLLEINRASRQSAFAFVAMWFDPAMNAIYDAAIEPAIRESGYKPVRIDRVLHANRIDDEIIGRIKGSRFMVADFTGQRPGVYFEAGLMLGLGRTVIWTCRKDDLNNVHFDARQYNFIDYETAPELKKRLHDKILAIEGQGPQLPA